MEEIGCHFKFEKIIGNIYHDTNLLLSSGRNCLKYIINERNITTLFLPYFLCESLSEVAISENVKIEFYHIDNNFMPLDIDENKLNDTTYIYFVNYYGLFKDNIQKIIDKYKYVIVDNTHDFFNKDNYGVDVIYNYRKYFGVPDGACIVSNDLVPNSKYSKGKSLDKVIEMLSRDETGQYFHYPTFLEADKHFRNEDLCYMSNFTENYLRAIDYETVLKNRLRNYDMLYESLKKYNQLDLSSKQLTYMYPLFVSDGESLRAYLKSNNIYSLRLWANINWNGANSDEITKADNMVLLPIDQRYSDNEMEYIASVIDKYYSNNHNKSKILVRGNNERKKKKTFDLVSSNEEVNSVLNNMKSNSKVYLKLITGLQLLGNFEGKTEIDFYDKIDDDKEKKIRLWCTDSDDNLFVFYGYSSDRTDLLKITKETNEETLEYDLTLAKKFALNSNNINFTRSNQIYGFKFGRLITDSNNFYSLFLRDDIGYQIQGDLNTNIAKELLSELNKLENLPKLTDYLNIFERILSVKNIHFSMLSISAFKDFENIGSFQINDEKSKSLTLKK